MAKKDNNDMTLGRALKTIDDLEGTLGPLDQENTNLRQRLQELELLAKEASDERVRHRLQTNARTVELENAKRELRHAQELLRISECNLFRALGYIDRCNEGATPVGPEVLNGDRLL